MNSCSISYADDTVKCTCGVTFSIDNPNLIYCPKCGQFYEKINSFQIKIKE